MSMTDVNKSESEVQTAVIPATLRRVYAYVNRNKKPTVSANVEASDDKLYTIHLSLVDKAKPITVEKLRHYGITTEMFDSDLDIPVKIKIFSDDSEPELIGKPRDSNPAVVKSLGL